LFFHAAIDAASNLGKLIPSVLPDKERDSCCDLRTQSVQRKMFQAKIIQTRFCFFAFGPPPVRSELNHDSKPQIPT